MSISSTHPERPIEDYSNDKLERNRFIERLADAVISPSGNRSTGVVIGITGPWGSGKSSILNLFRRYLEQHHENALVINFDPWLVSGRNDLIAEFFGELIGTINADKKQMESLKNLAKTVAEYGAQLAPVGDLWVAGAGRILSSGLNAMKSALSNKRSLSLLRKKILSDLEKVSVPIIVLIDEIDRVDDEEIRVVAQLVRSVADFPSISYILAYDATRVIQALGAGKNEIEVQERGRGYLEKIVQLQIPLPVTFSDEVGRFLTESLGSLEGNSAPPKNFENVQRYQDILALISTDLISTLRDVQRLISTYQVLKSMLVDEVDWIDLLAYSVLIIKAPMMIDLMRANPEVYLGEVSQIDLVVDQRSESREDRLERLIPAAEHKAGTTGVLEFLFPWISGGSHRDVEHADALCRRRTFLTTLRLGLLPGSFSRDDVQRLVALTPSEIEWQLRRYDENGQLAAIIDRLDELYVDLEEVDHRSLWNGVGQFVQKPDGKWLESYSPMHQQIRNLAAILLGAAKRDPHCRSAGESVFRTLVSTGESELTAYWLRSHIHTHGLFGNQKTGGEDWFLGPDETEEFSRYLANRWRGQHLARKLISFRWDLQPLYTMIDLNVWDEECRSVLDELLSDDVALDGMVLMLYGAHYSTDSKTVEKMCDYDKFLDRVNARLGSSGIERIDETVRISLKKALKGGW